MDNILSHVQQGMPGMVDISDKPSTLRTAIAQSSLTISHELAQILTSNNFVTKKGPLFSTAIIAGTMAVKNTAGLIPFCHPLLLQHIHLDCTLKGLCIDIVCEVSAKGPTGVEMEALVGASVAALTIYDMCKAYSLGMVIEQTKLQKKTGGKSDFYAKKNRYRRPDSYGWKKPTHGVE